MSKTPIFVIPAEAGIQASKKLNARLRTLGMTDKVLNGPTTKFCSLLLTAYCLLLTVFSFLRTAYCLLFAALLLTVIPSSVYALDQGSLDQERLGIIKSDIKKEIEYNEKLKKGIEEAQKGMDDATTQRLLKVSKIYETMPPEEAAKALEKLDEDTAAAILSSLKPKKAGAILAQMDSDKAASISKKLITNIPKPPK